LGMCTALGCRRDGHAACVVDPDRNEKRPAHGVWPFDSQNPAVESRPSGEFQSIAASIASAIAQRPGQPVMPCPALTGLDMDARMVHRRPASQSGADALVAQATTQWEFPRTNRSSPGIKRPAIPEFGELRGHRRVALGQPLDRHVFRLVVGKSQVPVGAEQCFLCLLQMVY